jgi:hypothetical protein
MTNRGSETHLTPLVLFFCLSFFVIVLWYTYTCTVVLTEYARYMLYWHNEIWNWTSAHSHSRCTSARTYVHLPI